MRVEQFVMAYSVEQDRIRAILPEGFESLRPVLRINAEIRDHGEIEEHVYLELNTPVEAREKRGWLNIANWESPDDNLWFSRQEKTITITTPFLRLSYTPVGIRGGCPAEKDNDGCFYLGEPPFFRRAEKIDSDKEFCDCEFSWLFHEADAHGISTGKSLPAYFEKPVNIYRKKELSAENAASLPCRQVLGAYVVHFVRK